MRRCSLTLTGGGSDGRPLVCRGSDDGGAEIVIEATRHGTPDQATIQVATELVRRGLALKTSARPLAFEYDTVTEREIPVLYCYPEGVTRAPVVFFNHGTGGAGAEQLFMGLPLAERGFFVVMPDAWHHGRRRAPDFAELFSGKRYKETYVNMLIHTCEDISRLLDHLRGDPRADVDRAGITGVSQGGFVSFLAITMDRRLRVAAPMIGSPDLEDRFGSSLPLAEHAPDVIDLVVRTSPLRNFRRMHPVALLVQNGAKDEAVPITGVRKLDEQLKPLYRDMPDRYKYIEYPDLGHSDQGMRDPAIRWLAKHLGLDEDTHT